MGNIFGNPKKTKDIDDGSNVDSEKEYEKYKRSIENIYKKVESNDYNSSIYY